MSINILWLLMRLVPSVQKLPVVWWICEFLLSSGSFLYPRQIFPVLEDLSGLGLCAVLGTNNVAFCTTGALVRIFCVVFE